ncbi:hypothetical protein ACFVMC_21190 [Nocardia sp. NPDC127579]|uniref:hypothetical protein n=1 Tax=Nocardia sp. NPDC127579 TaxID=3345402 RepID=UPI003627A678
MSRVGGFERKAEAMRYGIARKTMILAVLAVAAVGCGDGTEPATPISSLPAITSSTPVPSQPEPSVTTAVSQPSSRPPADPPQEIPPSATGTAMVFTLTQAQHPVPNVPVGLRQVTPCDAAGRDIPEGAREVLRFDGVTDAQGRAVFTVPVGCYRMIMGEPPAGTRPVPEGMHALFLTRAGETVKGTFRFQDAGWPPVCSAETIVADLAAGGELYPGQADPSFARVRECEGRWGIVSWNTPGDTQRIVQHDFERWTTYVAFPHDVCWSKAAKEGVPQRLESYFGQC